MNTSYLTSIVILGCTALAFAGCGRESRYSSKHSSSSASGRVVPVMLVEGEIINVGPDQAKGYRMAVEMDRRPQRPTRDVIMMYEAVIALDSTSAIADVAQPRLEELRERLARAEREAAAQRVRMLQAHSMGQPIE